MCKCCLNHYNWMTSNISSACGMLFSCIFFKVSIIILNSAYFVMTLNLKKKKSILFSCWLQDMQWQKTDGWIFECNFPVFLLDFCFFCWVWLIVYSIHYIISIFMSAFLQPFCLNSKLFFIQCAVWLVESEKSFIFQFLTWIKPQPQRKQLKK